MSRRLLKFKMNDYSGVTIVYERENENLFEVFDEYRIKCADQPRSELVAALGKMAKHVVDMCELPNYTLSSIDVIGLTVTHTAVEHQEEDVQGVVISGVRRLKNSNAPMIINTPHFTREPLSPDADKGVFSFECAIDVDRLEQLVFAYVDGERAQLDLFDEDEPEVAIG